MKRAVKFPSPSLPVSASTTRKIQEIALGLRLARGVIAAW